MSDTPSVRPLALVGNTCGPLLSGLVDSLLRVVVLELPELDVVEVEVVVALDFVDDVVAVDDDGDGDADVGEILDDDDVAAAPDWVGEEQPATSVMPAPRINTVLVMLIPPLRLAPPEDVLESPLSHLIPCPQLA
jgi:hypothetical protein